MTGFSQVVVTKMRTLRVEYVIVVRLNDYISEL